MNKGIIFSFIFGAAIGSVITWKLVKTKYEQIAKEEIESVKETFSNRANKAKEDVANLARKKPDLADYAERLKNEGYSEKEGEDTMSNKPYIIRPEELGELDGYDVKSFTYYADDVLADEFDNPIDDEEIDILVGADFAHHFGEYEDDSVFVRNDDMKTDYEILKDLDTFYDVQEVDDEPKG